MFRSRARDSCYCGPNIIFVLVRIIALLLGLDDVLPLSLICSPRMQPILGQGATGGWQIYTGDPPRNSCMAGCCCHYLRLTWEMISGWLVQRGAAQRPCAQRSRCWHLLGTLWPVRLTTWGFWVPIECQVNYFTINGHNINGRKDWIN